MALPQSAMAHLGSRVEASAKVFSDSVYWKECRSATAFSIVGCTSAEQLVGKSTLPSWPEAGVWGGKPLASKSSVKNGDTRQEIPAIRMRSAYRRMMV